MKHFLFLLFLTYTSIGFSQTESNLFKNKYEEFDYYAKPSKTNKLSKYFRNRFDSNLLDAYKISETDESKNHVYLTFMLDVQNKITGIYVNSPYSRLSKSIREIFKNYDIDDFNIPEKNPLNVYVLQILSKEGDKMVFNCSTDIVYDRFPVFEGCEPIMTTFNNMKVCLNEQLEAHIVNNISITEIEKAKIVGFLNLKVKFLINEKGNIEQINCKAPTDSLTKELNRLIALFPGAKTPPTRNGKSTNLVYDGTIRLKIEPNDEKKQEEVLKPKDSTLNPNGELALHFKKFISKEELRIINFPSLQKSINLSFSIDEKGNPIEFKTNSQNQNIDNRLIEIFKKFQFEKLNIKSTNILETYSYTIITQVYNEKVIECNEKPNVYLPPIIRKNCEKSKNPHEVINCLNQYIGNIIINEYKTNLSSKTQLKGIIKVYCNFNIDTIGNIVKVKVISPNPHLTKEIEKIITGIPKMYKPAYLNGVAYETSFNLPLRFDIGDNKAVEPFQNLNKSIKNIP
nr:hypothetical protein [uncultured Flavobacterium sp.]